MRTLAFCSFIFLMFMSLAQSQEQNLEPTLSYQTETMPGSHRYHRLERQEIWSAANTAVIVCDVWDSHHCVNAVRRVAELTPRIDAFTRELRRRGGLVIHAPSDCMESYVNHPSRQRAKSIVLAETTPTDIDAWCDRIPAEEAAAYPIDQSDGGEDDDLAEHSQWAETLAAQGLNPRAPWKAQTSGIFIDQDRDFISDKGPEIWNILQQHKIEHVLLLGVHTNMCVLGRPFGLRQLAQHGYSVALVRDLTDTMYNPRAWPYVDHFSGTDLIVDHIERYVCPTVTSSFVLGGEPFRFRSDKRLHLAILTAEDEYDTEQTLTRFANEHLRRSFQVSIIYGPEPTDNVDLKRGIPGIEAISKADVLLVSVRRRPLPSQQMQIVRDFLKSGRPVVGLRTASHAFALRDGTTPEGLTSWPEFDAEAFGGHYTNHFGNDLTAHITAVEQDSLAFIDSASFVPLTSKGSLYKVSPLASGAAVLLVGKVADQPAEPVAWTFVRPDSGRSFYTSLGHPSDFELPAFRSLLLNAIHWSVDLPSVPIEQMMAYEDQYRTGQGKQR